MSKPLKLMFKTFPKDTTQSDTSSFGSVARDYSSLFFGEKCDIFIMQNGRMSPGSGGNQSPVVGTKTRRFDSTQTPTGVPVNFLNYSWLPPYFFEAIRTETNNTNGQYLIDKFSLPPSFPFKIIDSAWFSVTTEGTHPVGVFTGLHAMILDNGSGQNIVIGSYVQFGNAGSAQNRTNFTEIINKMLIYSGNYPFILCSNLELTTSNVKTAFNNSNGVSNCNLVYGDSPFLSNIFMTGNNQTLEPHIFFVTKGLSINVELVPLPSFKNSSSVIEYPATIISLTNFIVQDRNIPYYANAISNFLVGGGSLTNNLNL